MRKIKKIMLLIIVFVIALIMKENTVYAESTIQVIPDKSAWTSITVSDAYDVCQKLNKNYSTLGTESLKAHLTTNADWYAVSLLTYSTYGNKNASNTTGNKTGVINFGTTNTFSSSIIEGASSTQKINSLYENLSSQFGYVESIKNSTNRANNVFGRGLLEGECITTQFGVSRYGNQMTFPVCVRSSLFGLYAGVSEWNYGGNGYMGCDGRAIGNTTFRPVIWNK